MYQSATVHSTAVYLNRTGERSADLNGKEQNMSVLIFWPEAVNFGVTPKCLLLKCTQTVNPKKK